MSESIYLTNFNDCTPAQAVSAQWETNCWRAVPYETVDGIKGTMLMATTDIDPQPVELPLNLKGWYRIFLGLGGPGLDSFMLPSVKVKLTDDPAYVMLQTSGRFWWMELKDVFWKEADLTNQSLHLAKPNGLHNGGSVAMTSYLAYIRLEPLSENEVESIKQDRANNANKRIIATEDGWSAIAVYNYKTAEELYQNILPYQHSDVQKIFYCASAGDTVNYPETSVGTAPQMHKRPVYPRRLDKTFVESMEIFRSKQIDPVEELCDFSHKIGLEFHANIRVGSFACEPPFDEFFWSKYYTEHPELHCRDKDGREIPRLSYAFHESQQHMLALCEEIAQRNIDGFGWVFVRGLPVILYEKPLIDAVKSKYGCDPCELPDDDEMVCKCRAELFTDFMRKVKQRLDALRVRQGRPPLQYHVIVPATQKVNYLLGLDVATWVKEGLIDILGVDYSVQDRNNPFNESPNNLELDYFLQIVQGTKCLFSPRIGYFEDERGVKNMAELYQKGLQSGFIWDGKGCYESDPECWSIVKKYGHQDLVAQWAKEGKKPLHKFIKLKSLGNFTMDKFPGNLAY